MAPSETLARAAPNRPQPAEITRFSAEYAPADERLLPRLLAEAAQPDASEERVTARARRYIEGIREARGGIGGLEDFMHDYSLSTKEGLALMSLAEALLRVPDAATQDRLIEDKLGAGDWEHAAARDSESWLVSATTWALGLTARIVHPPETPESVIGRLAQRLGTPTVRTAARQAMRLLGHQFVLGENIADALSRGKGARREGYRHSFDMLGEGARTAADARRYFDSYANAIEAIGRSADGVLPDRPGISVKLSALHPRYIARQHERVMRELTPRLIELAQAAKAHDLNLTVDAEEADRLELSLDVFARVLAEPKPRRLGRFRPRCPGLSEASTERDRLAGRGFRRVRPPADGPAGQGRLLGYGDQARPGARPRRFPGLHPQAGHRSLLSRLRP
jgi:RHH-type proline utilization regulon transcriptional repressor/proline dehydrogenase/delta 1-pyrroline-5-carboxylate dehydrogenase